MPESVACTILVIAGHDAALGEACATLAARVPAASIVRVEPDLLRRLPAADALLVTDAAHARVARATGFAGEIAVLGTPASDDARASLHAQGTRFVDPGAIDAGLLDALRLDRAREPVAPEVARTRRLLAAGELAFGLQHAFNNPLTALMAEIQMLQMAPPTPEAAASADRMLVLVRRLIEISRSLDAVRDRPRQA